MANASPSAPNSAPNLGPATFGAADLGPPNLGTPHLGAANSSSANSSSANSSSANSSSANGSSANGAALNNSVANSAPPKRQRDAIGDFFGAVGKGAATVARSTSQGVSHAATHATTTVAKAAGATAKAAEVTAKAAAQTATTSVRKINFWPLLAWLVRLAFLPVLILTYMVVSAEGIRSLFDGLATPLHKYLPILGLYQELRKLDVATMLALVLLALVWLAWEKVIHVYLWPPETLLNEEKLLWVVGGGLIFLDSILFFLGIQAGGGFLINVGTSIFGALVMTGLYVLMLIFAAYLVVKIDS